MARRKRFYLFKRKMKNGVYWYVSFIDLANGKQMTARSVEVLRSKLGIYSTEPIRYRDEACIIADKALEKGLVFNGSCDIRFCEYCLNFWDFDNSSYVRTRNYMSENSIGREYCKNMEGNFRNNVMPLINRKLYLDEVRTIDLERIVETLFEAGRLSSGSIAMVVLSFSIPLKEAKRLGLIQRNPAEQLEKVRRKSREKGIFTTSELKMITDSLESVRPVYGKAIRLGMITGMRMGEIRALRKESIIVEKDRHRARIVVDHSWAPYSKLKCPKGKYSRELHIPLPFAEELVSLSEGEYIFSRNGTTPITDKSLRKYFYLVLQQAGIDETERERRNLTFHSLRHTFASISKDMGMSIEDRMAIMGHRSYKMNMHYTHVTDEQLDKIADVVDKLEGMTRF